MKIANLTQLIKDDAGFHTTESVLAITVVTLVSAMAVFTFGGSVAEFLASAGEEVKASGQLLPLFGQNPLTN